MIEVSACFIKSNTEFAPVKDMYKEERKKDIQMSLKRLKWPCSQLCIKLLSTINTSILKNYVGIYR